MRFRVAAALSCLCLSMHAHANLLTNGGAEKGTLAGWTAGGLSAPRIDNGSFDPGIGPHGGSYMFLGGVGAWGTLTQRVALDGVGNGCQLTMSFWERGLDQGEPSDNGYVSLTYFTAGGSLLGAQNSSIVDSHKGAWTRYQGTFDVPLDAASVDYTMHFVRNFGIDLDAFFDDNALTLTTNVPEPSTGWLVGAGIAVLAAARRYRR